MYELEYLYEQLKTQTVEQQYIQVLDSISEAAYDTLEYQNKINETVELIEETAKKARFNFFDKLKAQLTSVEKVLDKYKEPALKCKPIGLEYKDFKTFMSVEGIKKMHNDAIKYLNKFNPNNASAEELKQYIIDSQHNVQYKELIKIFGKGKEQYDVASVIITSKRDKDITKDDISKAVKFLESYKKQISIWQAEFAKKDAEFTNHVRSDAAGTFSMNKTNTDINTLRKNAMNHKTSLTYIADDFYYQQLFINYNNQAIQAKRIVVKAANYNPRNLKESAVIQDYIDAMSDFNQL